MSLIREYQEKRGKWESSEDEALKKAVDELGHKYWKEISKRVYGRTSIQCLHRWTKILKPGLIKGPWTNEEDAILKNWVSENGAKKWSHCAKIIPGRNCKQCRERWFNNIDPNIKKGGWSLEEDAIIFNFFQTLGSKWAFISNLLPGRTENSIKNRFYSSLRKYKNKVKSLEEISIDYMASFNQTSLELLSSNLETEGKLPFFQMGIKSDIEKWNS